MRAVFGSMIAGTATIIITYWIIRRSYKIDYHNKRMSVLPVFRLTIPKRHFSNYPEEKEQWNDELESVAPVFDREVERDMICFYARTQQNAEEMMQPWEM